MIEVLAKHEISALHIAYWDVFCREGGCVLFYGGGSLEGGVGRGSAEARGASEANFKNRCQCPSNWASAGSGRAVAKRVFADGK